MKESKPKPNLKAEITFFSAEDKEKAEQLAKKEGLKLSAWARSVIYRQLN